MSPHPLRRWGALLGAAVLLAAGAGPAVAVPAGPVPPAGPAPRAGEQRVNVVITLRDQPTKPSSKLESSNLYEQDALIASWKDRFNLQPGRRFGYLVNGLAASIPVSQISALSLEPQVASVRRERVYERTEHTARGLEGVPAAFAAEGLDGTGMVVAIIDSGMDTSHQDLRLDDCGAAKIQRIEKRGHFTCKVPAGYDYADEDFDVKEPKASSHGMHVSGIVAANGSEGDDPADVTKTGRVDGVAPNAQLLAMKVFPDKSGGAADSDIVAAIEDSVKLGADVINMSLGSPNGQKDASNATGMAIDRARDAGVITAVAAGNDGQNFSPDGVNDDVIGKLDDGTVGSPGTQGSAFTVASLNNSANTRKLAYYGADDTPVPYELATGEPDAASHPLVDIGLADKAGVDGRDLTGSYALIERGGISFTEKYENAIAAGAEGIVIFNSAAGGDASFGMAGVDDFDIPGIAITRSAGLKIREQIAAGGSSIRITSDVTLVPDATGLQASSFTSWGSTPTLDFEPEIAGIGGNVYSTYNDNTYGNSSGTSMASPNVAGLSALVFEHLKQTRPDVTGAARVDLARNLLMNTAQIPNGPNGVPASPRQVGAGLARVDLAIHGTVTATVDGEAAAALREVHSKTSFTVKFDNSGDAARSFDVPTGQQVIAETEDADGVTETRVSSGTLNASATSVTVPAHGTAEVTVTVTPESGADHFFGGWFALTSTDAAQADLTVPYLGFAGDWNAEPIILAPGESLIDRLDVSTELLTSWGGMVVPLSSELGEFWLSPNGDGDMDGVMANLAVLRNASDVEYRILTEDGKAVKTIGKEQGVGRETLGDYLHADSPADLEWTGATFDGLAWDAAKADLTAVPDGRYIYQVRSRLSENSPWQTVDLPFGVDATPPSIEWGSYEAGVLTFTVTDEGSGLLATPTVSTPGGRDIEPVDRGDGVFAVEVDAAQVPYVTVSALDHGFSLAVASRILNGEDLVVDSASTLESTVLTPASAVVSKGSLVVTGYTSPQVAQVRVGGNDPVDAANGRFRDGVKLVEGAQTITVEALAKDGSVLASRDLKVTYDATAPVLTLDEKVLQADGTVALDDQGQAVLSGTVRDERADAKVTLTALVGKKKVDIPVGADGTFHAQLTPGADDATIVLTASDGGNETARAVPIAGRTAADSTRSAGIEKITNADCALERGVCFVPGNTPDANEDGSEFTVRGIAGPGTAKITFQPGQRANDEGVLDGAGPIDATIASDGTFSAKLPVKTGENHFRLTVTDEKGKAVYDGAVRFYYDVTAPTLQMDKPMLVGGTLFTNTEQVEFAGTASDDGWGYTFALNDSVVIERFHDSSIGAVSNERSFSTEVTVADGDTILVSYRDANGNVLVSGIPVVLDQKGPQIDIAGVAQDERLNEDREIAVTATDENLATLQVSVDGEEVASEATELSTKVGPVEDSLVDLRDRADDAGDIEVLAGQTAPISPELTAKVDTSTLASGHHTLSVTSTDLAGNVSTKALTFTIEPKLTIAGPDRVALEITRDLLDDQAALAAQVLAGHEAQLNGDAAAAKEAGVTLALAPGTALREGEQKVTVIATAADGRKVETELTVAITLKRITLTSGDVSATSTFRADDALTATFTKEKDARILTLSNREGFASLPSEITLPLAKGSRVFLVGPDGTAMPVKVTWKDGKGTFEGPSRGVYRILPPAAAPQKPGGPVQPGTPGAPGQEPGTPGQKPGEGGQTGADAWGHGSIARTGVEIGASLLAVAFMLTAGTALTFGGVRKRRR